MSAPVVANGSNPSPTSAQMLGWSQQWDTPATFPAVNGKPIGVYKVKNLEVETLKSRFNEDVSVGFTDTDAGLMRVKLGDATKSSLELKSANVNAVTLNATGADSSFVLQSGATTKQVAFKTDTTRTTATSSANGFVLASSLPTATGQAAITFGADKSVTLRASDSTNAATLLKLVTANVDVQAANLNADADVRVKQGLAMQKDATTLAVARLANVATDFASVTIGGVPGAPNTQPARFETGASGAKTWLNGGSHFFDGNKLGINLPANTSPTAELDVNGRMNIRQGLVTSSVWASETDTTMSIGWGMNQIGDVNTPRKIVLQADTIEIIGGIDMMNKSEMRVVDTTVYLGHIPMQTDVDESQALPGAPGLYADSHYDGAGVVLWNMPDNFQAAHTAITDPQYQPSPKDYQQGLRWYKRGGIFSTAGDKIAAWNRASWEVSGGNLTLRAGTGHASYMFAIDYEDGDALKLYRVNNGSISEVASFNIPQQTP